MRVACATFRSFTDWLCVVAKKHKRLLQFAMTGESDYSGDWRLPRFARNDKRGVVLNRAIRESVRWRTAIMGGVVISGDS